jgi:hypothetical protein
MATSAYTRSCQQISTTSADAIGRMGSGTITLAATGIIRQWKMQNRMRTPRYTTRWDELVRVT